MTESADMVERVARALCRMDGGKITGPSRHKASDEFKWDPNRLYMDAYVEKHWREHVSTAYAAIQAMREPTEAMLHASYQIDGFWTDGPDHGDVYRAMIDASLPTKD